MTGTLFLLAATAAVIDWVAVGLRLVRIEYLVKPLTLALLVAAAASADLHQVKGWVLAALLCGLAGDIALLRSTGQPARTDAAFLLGLGAFLAGHVCYLAAFSRYGLHPAYLLFGALVVAATAGLTLTRVLAATLRLGGPELTAIVGAYASVLAAMAICAVGTALLLTAAGGLLFLVSDTVLAHERFVRRIRFGELAVIVTYHLAQGLIVLGLVAG